MKEETPERWLVAAWPGLGQVATTAAIYLLSKLRMHQVAEFRARDLFELESVEVTGGLLHAARLPRSRLFLWRNPTGGGRSSFFWAKRSRRRASWPSASGSWRRAGRWA